MLDQAVGPNVIKRLLSGLDKFIEEHANDGWKSVEDFRAFVATESCCSRRFVPRFIGILSGYETVEGYAAPQPESRRCECNS